MEEVRIEREAAEQSKHDYSKEIREMHDKVDVKVVKTGEMVDKLVDMMGLELDRIIVARGGTTSYAVKKEGSTMQNGVKIQGNENRICNCCPDGRAHMISEKCL